MRASLLIPLPGLTKDGTDAKAKAIAKPLGLSVRGLGGEHTPIGADGTIAATSCYSLLLPQYGCRLLCSPVLSCPLPFLKCRQ